MDLTGVLFGVISKGTLMKKLLMVKRNILQESPPGIATWQLHEMTKTVVKITKLFLYVYGLRVFLRKQSNRD